MKYEPNQQRPNLARDAAGFVANKMAINEKITKIHTHSQQEVE